MVFQTTKITALEKGRFQNSINRPKNLNGLSLRVVDALPGTIREYGCIPNC